jgi:hypothetical protein
LDKQIVLKNGAVYAYDADNKILQKSGSRGFAVKNAEIVRLRIGEDFLFKISDENGKVVVSHSSGSPVRKIRDL